MMNERGRVPEACPCCDGELVVTRLRCVRCGLEMSGDFGGHRCAERPATSAEAPSSAVPTVTEVSPEVPPARDQILARVAAGELDPVIAAELLGRLD